MKCCMPSIVWHNVACVNEQNDIEQVSNHGVDIQLQVPQFVFRIWNVDLLQNQDSISICQLGLEGLKIIKTGNMELSSLEDSYLVASNMDDITYTNIYFKRWNET